MSIKQLLKVKEQLIVGLDIGTSAVKIVKLRFTKEKPQLHSFNSVSIDPDLETVLKKVAHSEDIKRINISVAGPAVTIRYADFPQMEEEELRQSLKFEAQKYIPFSLGEVNLDGHILKRNHANNKMLVLVAAVKKDFIHQRLKLIEDAGMSCRIIDVDSLALINAFNFNYLNEKDDDNLRHKAVALLNIGASWSNLNILQGSIPYLSRDMQIAGNSFTQKLQEILGCDFATAEKAKLNPDKAMLDKISLSFESVFSALANELRTSFDYYESQSASSVARIFLSGGGGLLSGLKDALTNLLNIEVEYWDPLKNIDIADTVDSQKIKALSGQLCVAIGLALRR